MKISATINKEIRELFNKQNNIIGRNGVPDFHVSPNKEGIQFTAKTCSCEVTISMPCTVESWPFDPFLIPRDEFLGIVAKEKDIFIETSSYTKKEQKYDYSKGETVTTEVTVNQIKITGKQEYTLIASCTVEEFPFIDEQEWDRIGSMQEHDIAHIQTGVLPCVAVGCGNNPVLNSVYFGEQAVVATDSRTMAVYEPSPSILLKESSAFCMPSIVMKNIPLQKRTTYINKNRNKKSLPDGTVSVGQEYIQLSQDGFCVTFIPDEGSYPSYKRILPNTSKKMLIEVDPLVDFLQFKAKPEDPSFDHIGLVCLYSKGNELWAETQRLIPAQKRRLQIVSSSSLDIAFNPNFLKRALAYYKKQKVSVILLEWTDKESPFKISKTNCPVVHVIMPIVIT